MPTILQSSSNGLRVSLYVIALGLLCPGMVKAQSGQRGKATGPQPSVEQQVLQASREWADALSRNDVEAVDRLLADDAITIQQSGNNLALIEKPVQLESLRKAGASRPKSKRELSRVRVKNYGNVAILTALASYEAQLPNGGQQRSQGLICEVWVNVGGGWRLTHFQPTAEVVAR
jgi:ketosteroid isomerase-like protein